MTDKLHAHKHTEATDASTLGRAARKLLGPDCPTLDFDIPTGELFDLLANARRRAIMLYLAKHGKSCLRDVASEIAAAEAGGSEVDLGSQAYKRVRVSAHQCHVPRLESHGLIDVARDELSLTDDGKRAVSFLIFFEQEVRA